MRYALLTLTTLAALIPEEISATVEIIDEGVDDIDPDRIDADRVGISAITGTAPHAYELSARLRTRGSYVSPLLKAEHSADALLEQPAV